jgi:hypothetical protein
MSMWRAVVPAHPSYTRGAAVPAASPEQAPGLTQWELDPFASRSRLRFPPVCRGVCAMASSSSLSYQETPHARTGGAGPQADPLKSYRYSGSVKVRTTVTFTAPWAIRGQSGGARTRSSRECNLAGLVGRVVGRAPSPPGASRCQGWCVAACPLVPGELALNRRGVPLRGGRALPCCLRLAGELGPGQRDRRKRGTY